MKPILFNTEMVKAILDGRKTQTRRVIKMPIMELMNCRFVDGDIQEHIGYPLGHDSIKNTRAKYKVGDILYVRETFKVVGHYPDNAQTTISYTAGGQQSWDNDIDVLMKSYKFIDGKNHPSIHMPKELARIFLKVTAVRVERLQDITTDDAIKEGSLYFESLIGKIIKNECGTIPKTNFAHIWNSTIKKKDLDKYSWEANPYVFVYKFERVEKGSEVNEDK